MALYRRSPKGNWFAEYTDVYGRRQRVTTKTANKTAAQKILDQLRIDSATARAGVPSIGRSQDLQVLITQYIDYLGGTAEKHRQVTETRIRRIADAAGWTDPKQMTQYQVETIVRQLPSLRRSKPLSLRTQSHYLTAIKSFSRWLSTVRMATVRDPLAAIKKPNWEGDRKIIRRFLLESEWIWLSKTPNALLYETAIQTGYRASEISRLNRSSLRDDHLYLPGSATKNKRNATQYITQSLRNRLVDQLPFIVPHRDYLAETLRRDMSLARKIAIDAGAILKDDCLQPLDSRGHTLDFHALRHTCGAWLAIHNVNVKVIQSVMRHRSISLTLDTYGHLLPGAEKEAITGVMASILSNPS